jgi:hypothetical protein
MVTDRAGLKSAEIGRGAVAGPVGLDTRAGVMT